MNPQPKVQTKDAAVPDLKLMLITLGALLLIVLLHVLDRYTTLIDAKDDKYYYVVYVGCAIALSRMLTMRWEVVLGVAAALWLPVAALYFANNDILLSVSSLPAWVDMSATPVMATAYGIVKLTASFLAIILFNRLLAALGVDMRMAAMISAMLVIWFILDYLTDGIFFRARNLYNLSVQSSTVGIMATGMVLVIVARHIDLSVGSVLGFTGMVIATLQAPSPLGYGWPWPYTLAMGLAVGAAVGLWQGWWIAYRGVPAFVVTLAGLMAFRGAAYMTAAGRTMAPMDETYQILGGGIDGSIGELWSWVLGLLAVAGVLLAVVRGRLRKLKYGFTPKAMWAEVVLALLGVGMILGFVQVMNSYYMPRTEIPRGIPVPVLILIGVVLIMSFVASATKFGRYVFAIGGNPEAAELAGINVKRVSMIIFVVMGLLAGLAGAVTTARLNAGLNSMGTLMELNVIAAAVIGGTSLAGGVGTIVGAILGAVIMQSLENGIVLMGYSSDMRQIVIGLVLVFAVWFDVVYNQKKR